MCDYTEDELALERWFDEGNPNFADTDTLRRLGGRPASGTVPPAPLLGVVLTETAAVATS